MINNCYQTLSALIDAHRTEFMTSDKSELGIFWIDDDLSMIIHVKTLLEEDIDKNNPTQYSFKHYDEWHNHPPEYPGDYADYPRGRIFFQDGKYAVEVNVRLPSDVEAFIRHYFSLPVDTIFKTGYW
jgi:hypothetical protein